VENAVSKQWLQAAGKKVPVRFQLSIIEPGWPPLLVIKANVN
jgi:hypothetical protein